MSAIKNVVKLTPKQISVTSAGAAGSSTTVTGSKIAVGDGKFVVIQNSKGIQIPLKVVNQPKPVTVVTTQASTNNNIQIVKTGSNVQLLKPNNQPTDGSPTMIQIAPGANQQAGTSAQAKTKFIVKAGNNKQVILTSPTSFTSPNEAKKSVVGPASSIMIGKKFDGSPTIKGPKEDTGVVKILNQSQASPASNLHAVNIPGKGVQIVRILNTGVNTPSSTLTTLSPLTTTTSQILKKPQNHIVTKVASLPTNSTGETKLLLKNKDGQTVTVLKSPMTTMTKPTIVTSQERKVDVIKTEVVKRSAVTTENSDEPAQKKTKYITLTSAQINQIQGVTVMHKDGENKKIVMLPSNYKEQLEKMKKISNNNSMTVSVTSSPRTVIHPSSVTTSVNRITTHVNIKQETSKNEVADDEDNKKKKRACNCTKSMCLKFYCDCFANGEYCLNCNCKDCLNMKDCPEREKAIKLCLEKNPLAFKPKIASDLDDMQRLHLKGCNCKRSGCLKNYCECYEAKISCSGNCKCLGCKNCEDAGEKLQMELNYLKSMGKRGSISDDSAADVKIVSIKKDPNTSVVDVEITKKPYNFMTQDVIEATVQCMIAQGEECQKLTVTKRLNEKMILEEFGRCLVEIIEFSSKAVD